MSSLEHSIHHAANELGFEIAQIGNGVATRFAMRAFLAVCVCCRGQGRAWDAGGIGCVVFLL